MAAKAFEGDSHPHTDASCGVLWVLWRHPGPQETPTWGPTGPLLLHGACTCPAGGFPVEKLLATPSPPAQLLAWKPPSRPPELQRPQLNFPDAHLEPPHPATIFHRLPSQEIHLGEMAPGSPRFGDSSGPSLTSVWGLPRSSAWGFRSAKWARKEPVIRAISTTAAGSGRPQGGRGGRTASPECSMGVRELNVYHPLPSVITRQLSEGSAHPTHRPLFVARTPVGLGTRQDTADRAAAPVAPALGFKGSSTS